MIVKVLRAFGTFSEGQIIDSNKYSISVNAINTYIANGVVQIVEDYVEKVDEVSDSLMYYGKAYGGALSGDSVWTITKTTKVGTVTTREVFHNRIWDSRNDL